MLKSQMKIWSVLCAALGALLLIAGSGVRSESPEPRGPLTPTPDTPTPDIPTPEEQTPLEEAENGQCSAEVALLFIDGVLCQSTDIYSRVIGHLMTVEIGACILMVKLCRPLVWALERSF